MASEQFNSRIAKEDYGSRETDNRLQENDSEECTIQEALDALGYGRCQVWIAIVCGAVWTSEAINILLLSIISVVLKCEWRLTVVEGSLITSLPFIGQTIGSYFWGKCSDKYGRRVILSWTSFYIFWFSILSAFSPNITWLLIHRIIGTFMVGSSSQAITLLSEFLPNKHRGVFLGTFQFSFSFGVISSVVLALAVIPTMGWRWYLVISALPNTITILLLSTIPESPYYHLSIGETNKAEEIIQRVAKMNGKKPITKRLREDHQENHGNLKDLFATTDLTRSSILLVIIWFSASAAYYGVVLLTAESLADGNACSEFESDNSLPCAETCQSFSKEAYLNMIIVAVAELPAVLINMVLIDVIGRRAILFLAGMTFSLCFSLLLFCFSSQSITTSILFVSKCFSQVSFLALFTYTPEIYATPVRGLAVGMGTAFSKLGTIVAPVFAQILASYTVKGAVIAFVVIGVLGTVASCLLPIETKGQQIQTTSHRNSNRRSL
ncbi:synaptic vesicle 2-related protein-like [Apostichopus japonicus]|uniref:synaptic vesicle 2-related protein-like n=1 Tax=Stichopus japonicus TaxID=307972 RepID=UPI003AB4EF57